MTTNQIAYYNMQENKRANQAREEENVRSNMARETETNRSNLANELQKFFELEEKVRSNLANEQNQADRNLVKTAPFGLALALDQMLRSFNDPQGDKSVTTDNPFQNTHKLLHKGTGDAAEQKAEESYFPSEKLKKGYARRR